MSGELLAVLAFRGGYNTSVVLLGVSLLGLAAGTVGAFALLRRRAMMSDVLAHATLPGVVGAFLLATLLGADARSLPILLAGAVVAALVGVATVQVLAGRTRIPEDAAMGAVLSVFFGLGVVLLSVVQTLGTGAEGGLSRFILGQSAAMGAGDATLIGAVAAIGVAATLALWKPFQLVCFDPGFARVQGWPVATIDLLLMGLVAAVTVVGLQAVGLILVIALLIVPAAAARFWTERLSTTVALSGLFGAASAYCGAALSAVYADLPTGGVIVLCAGALFIASLFLAPRRGALAGALRRVARGLAVEGDHVLRALHEEAERAGSDPRDPIPRERLLLARGWSAPWRALVLGRLARRGLLSREGGLLALTEAGAAEAARLVRAHRLWEAYLMEAARIPPEHVHAAADRVEHVLDAGLVARLEARLAAAGRLPVPGATPPSPHPTGA